MRHSNKRARLCAAAFALIALFVMIGGGAKAAGACVRFGSLQRSLC